MPRYPDKTPGTGAAAVAVTITIGGGAVVGSKLRAHRPRPPDRWSTSYPTCSSDLAPQGEPRRLAGRVL
jgi:hypothetical protein